jgi:hypothetical protein
MGSDLVAAIGIALMLEGVAYAAFPDAMRRAAALLFAQGEQVVRLAGLLAAVVGAAVVLATRAA